MEIIAEEQIPFIKNAKDFKKQDIFKYAGNFYLVLANKDKFIHYLDIVTLTVDKFSYEDENLDYVMYRGKLHLTPEIK